MGMMWDESTVNSLLLACARAKDPARALVVAESCKRVVVKSEVCSSVRASVEAFDFAFSHLGSWHSSA